MCGMKKKGGRFSDGNRPFNYRFRFSKALFNGPNQADRAEG